MKSSETKNKIPYGMKLDQKNGLDSYLPPIDTKDIRDAKRVNYPQFNGNGDDNKL